MCIRDSMVVDETDAGLILYFHHLAISYDFKIVVSVVLDIVNRCLPVSYTHLLHKRFC